MADLIEKIKISQLPETTTANDASYIPIDNGNVTYKISVANYNSGANATAMSYAQQAAASASSASASASEVNLVLDEVNNVYDDFEEEKVDLVNDFASIRQSAQAAANSASSAATSATAAAASAQSCADIETSVRSSTTLSQSWAVGGTNTRQGEDTNNSKYYAEQASAVVSDLPSIIGPAVEEYIEEHPIQAPVTSVNNQTGDVVLDIPDEVTESTVAGWGFTKNTGTYSKPNTGIPASDLADAVQTSLEKADTALQSAPVTSVNGATGAVVVNVPSRTSDLINDSGFITSVPVTSVNGQTGAVTVSVPTKTSQITNDSGFLTSAVTSFNNQTGAVTYTAPVTSVNGMTGDVIVQGGGGGGDVVSVNGKTGVVVLDADDVGALPDNTVIPSKTSDLTNDSGFITSAPVASVNGATGTVVLTASDVGALPSSTSIPSKTSDLTNDSGFLTSGGAVTSFNGSTGAVTYTAPVTSVNGSTGAVVIGTATTSANGLMSATDKSHLDAVYADYSSAMTALGV